MFDFCLIRALFIEGRELEAPNYIYFSNLQFLNEAPLNKMDCCDDETSYTILLDDFEPTLLISKNIDYTIKFIQLVQNNSIPCDEKLFKNLKYIQEFKAIKKELNASFSASSLREYWISLIKKYKRWNENRHHLAPIMNEDVFKEMSHNCDVIENDTEVIEEEHIEEIDIETIESYEDDIEPQEEPSPKRARLTIQQLVEDNNKDNKTEDEYDFFAKKVALQLRQIAQKNLLVARKAEIEVLKLLMEHESIV